MYKRHTQGRTHVGCTSRLCDPVKQFKFVNVHDSSLPRASKLNYVGDVINSRDKLRFRTKMASAISGKIDAFDGDNELTRYRLH
jgi:hypothetical protein